MDGVDWHVSLLRSLKNRLAVVADRALYERDPQAHLAALQAASASLDQTVTDCRPKIPPDLAHYLDRQSYQKAIDWLENPSISR